jgi:hypothetical protein
LERQFLQLNATLGHILLRQGDEIATARHADRTDKELAQVYPQAAVGMQMLCEAPTSADLPPLLKILANLKKKDAAMAIQHAFDQRARMPDSTHVSPVVTPEMIENIYAFLTAGTHDVDALPSGFSLFLFLTGSPEPTATQARARTVTYSLLLHGGLVAPSLDQIREIVSGAPQMAHTLTALERCYQGYSSTFLDVMMGLHHRLSLHFRASLHFHEFVEAFQGLKQEIEEELGSEELHAVLPMVFQRHTQLAIVGSSCPTHEERTQGRS